LQAYRAFDRVIVVTATAASMEEQYLAHESSKSLTDNQLCREIAGGKILA
jgi:hypothetical protein